jgi:hypothetical protein
MAQTMPDAPDPSDKPTYHAAPGMEDRHGEMTGAISINMVLCMPAVAVWAIFIGPWLFAGTTAIVLSSLALAIVLPLACMPLSRRIWAWISHTMERSKW